MADEFAEAIDIPETLKEVLQGLSRISCMQRVGGKAGQLVLSWLRDGNNNN